MKHRYLIIITSLLINLFSIQVWAENDNTKKSLANFTPALTNEFKAILRNADIKAGGEYFERKCSNCHDHEKDGIDFKGPLLWNVFGRKAGSVKDFDYSKAMKKSGHSWNFATLNYYLTQTELAIPGRAMNFRGIPDNQTRANLLAYLRQFNDTPPALP